MRLIMVKITPLALKFESHIVQDVNGYNSWPMVQAIGDKLVCVYSRGSAHTINEHTRAVYARISVDRGQTWLPETVVANTSGHGEVAIGKGLDSEGAMLLWVRRIGEKFNHDLYRTTDGLTFTKIVTPKLDPIPMQITDVFDVPTVGLMALWFAGNYGPDGHSWGTLTSSDNGLSWKQHVMEADLDKANWPTEQSAVYLGDGKILAIARTEVDDTTTMQSQFQLISSDYGKTWKRTKTNISDVRCSTPSLMLDKETGLLSNYYYHRGRGVIKRRVVNPALVFDNPLLWSDAEAVATGSEVMFDAGNVNTTKIGGHHYLAYYSGEKPNTAVLVAETTPPKEAGRQQK